MGKVTEFATSAWPYLLKAAVWVALVAAPIRASMGAVCFLVIADLFTGIWAAVKRGEKFTSWGLRKTASKILAYEIAIVLAYVMETTFIPELPVMKGIAGFISGVELKSNLENLSRITGLDLWQAARGLLQGTKLNPEKNDVDRPSDSPDRPT